MLKPRLWLDAGLLIVERCDIMEKIFIVLIRKEEDYGFSGIVEGTLFCAQIRFEES
jgi:hypothetical protein